MAGGIASTLLSAARPRGRIAGELGLFEVDELWLEPVAAQLHGVRAVLLANLFRDQLDRYGELETIADSWMSALHDGPARRRGARAQRRRSDSSRISGAIATESCTSASTTTRSR